MEPLSPNDLTISLDAVDVTSSLDEAPPKKKSKKSDELPEELKAVNLVNRKEYVVCRDVEIKKTVVVEFGSRQAPKKELNVGEVHSMAVEVRIPASPTLINDNEKVFSLDMIGINQLREFAKGFGITCVSYLTKQALQYLIANSLKMNAIIDSSNVVDPSESEMKKRNTLLRMINVIFDPEFQQSLLSINDNKDYAAFETGSGRNHENFFVEVSEACNDHQRNKDFGALLFENDSDECIAKHISDLKILYNPDLKEFDILNCKLCMRYVHDLIKVRATINENMKRSGTHDSDAFEFVAVALKTLKLTSKIGKWPAYYFFVHASKVQGFDFKFQKFMTGSLKGGSGNLDDDNFSTPSVRSQKTSSEIDFFVESMKETGEQVSRSVSIQEKVLEVQQESLDLSRENLELSRENLGLSRENLEISRETAAARVQKDDIDTYRSLLELKEKFKTHRFDKKIAAMETKYGWSNESSEEDSI